MAIEIIDKLPVNPRSTTTKDLIRADIEEALKLNKPVVFEFKGEYKYTYLAVYAREVARQIVRKKINRLKNELEPRKLRPEETRKNGFYVRYHTYEYEKKYITIISRKDKELNRYRVYASIDFSNFEKDIEQLIDSSIERARREIK